jgi:nucleotide-binding universal stress UspA family protein
MHLSSHILVPLDGSPLAQEALPLGLALGRRHGQAVELVHVHKPPPMLASAPHVDPRFDREQRDEMQRWLSALTEAAAQEHGQAVTATFLDGAVARTLEDHVARRAPGLVVMATHGWGGLSRAWLGSVADRLVRHVHVLVLLIRPEPGRAAAAGDAAFRRVLVPLDGSKLAEQVLEPALALGAPGDTEYTLLTVVEPPQLSTPSVMMAVAASETASAAETLAQIAALRQAAAEQYLGLVGNQLRRRGVAVCTQVAVHPQPAQGILEYAATSGTDLIAVATHGLGGVARLLVGSVADKVIRGASAPVLVVHPTDRKRAAE